MYTLIGLGVLVIAALVVAYLSSKNWHWGQVVLVFFIFLAAVGYGVLAADVLRKHRQVRTEHNQVTAELERLTVQNAALLHGTRDASVYAALAVDGIEPADDELIGIRTLESRLSDLMRARGTVWRFIGRTGPPVPQTGAVPIRAELPPRPPVDEFAVEPQQPPPPQPMPLAGLNEGTIVFVFEQTGPGQPLGQYLGEFQVTQRNGPQAVIQPVFRESWDWPRGQQVNERLLRLRNSQLPWVLYDTMPADSYAAFAGLSEQDLRGLLPPASVEEYLGHGQPAGEEVDPRFKAPFRSDGTPLTEDQLADEPASDVQWRYQRPLRDYSLAFQTYARLRVEKFAEHDALLTDIQLLEQANQSATALQAARRAEIEKLEHERTGFAREAEIIQRHAETLEQELETVASRIQELLEANKQYAAELAQAQLNVLRQLEQTSAPATSAGGS